MKIRSATAVAALGLVSFALSVFVCVGMPPTRPAIAQVYGPGSAGGGLFSAEESKYIAETENTMRYFQGELSKLNATEGGPQPAFDAAKKEFVEKGQQLRQALSELSAGGSSQFYQHKPKVDAALQAYESAYQRAVRAFR